MDIDEKSIRRKQQQHVVYNVTIVAIGHGFGLWSEAAFQGKPNE